VTGSIAAKCPQFPEKSSNLVNTRKSGLCFFFATGVANNVEIMSEDSSKDYIYKFGSTEVLDTHMLTSSYASQLADHHFTQRCSVGNGLIKPTTMCW
jgi:hypothetical protein